jgi:hypothetical protein
VNTPTPAEIRARSELVALRFPDTAPGNEALTALAEVIGPLISELTGRAIGDAPGVEVPDYLVPVAEMAFALKVEHHPTVAKDRRKALTVLNLRSFSAGPYSESYFGPGEAAQIKRLDPDPELHEVLWALATPEKRAYWLLLWNEQVAPAAGVQTFAWGRRSRRSPRRV